MLLRILLDNIPMKFEKCRLYVLLYVGRFLILVPEFPNVTRLFVNVLFLSKVIPLYVKILKNLTNVSKNRRSGKLVFLPLNLLTKDFIIFNVIGSFLVVYDLQRRWHHSSATCTKASNPITVRESNLITAFYRIRWGYLIR